eukprot:g3324.t1
MNVVDELSNVQRFLLKRKKEGLEKAKRYSTSKATIPLPESLTAEVARSAQRWKQNIAVANLQFKIRSELRQSAGGHYRQLLLRSPLGNGIAGNQVDKRNFPQVSLLERLEQLEIQSVDDGEVRVDTESESESSTSDSEESESDSDEEEKIENLPLVLKEEKKDAGVVEEKTNAELGKVFDKRHPHLLDRRLAAFALGDLQGEHRGGRRNYESGALYSNLDSNFNCSFCEVPVAFPNPFSSRAPISNTVSHFTYHCDWCKIIVCEACIADGVKAAATAATASRIAAGAAASTKVFANHAADSAMELIREKRRIDRRIRLALCAHVSAMKKNGISERALRGQMRSIKSSEKLERKILSDLGLDKASVRRRKGEKMRARRPRTADLRNRRLTVRIRRPKTAIKRPKRVFLPTAKSKLKHQRIIHRPRWKTSEAERIQFLKEMEEKRRKKNPKEERERKRIERRQTVENAVTVGTAENMKKMEWILSKTRRTLSGGFAL